MVKATEKVTVIKSDLFQQAQMTVPMLVEKNYEKYGDRKVWMRRKDFGIWQRYTWKDCYQKIKYFSLGLVSLGMKPEDKVSVIGDNDPEYYWAEYAAQAVGGVFVGIYTDALPPEIKYIVEHSDSKFVVAHDQEQIDKLLSLREQGDIPKVKGLIYWDAKGLWSYEESQLYSFDEIIELGQKYEGEYPGSFEHNLEKVKPDDTALCIYTSGTTGLPKGVMITHQAFLLASWLCMREDPWRDSDNVLSYMSPAWMMEQWMSLGMILLSGATLNFVEEPETLDNDVREVGPDIIFYGSRLWESVASRIQVKISDSTATKRLAYKLALPVGYKIADARLSGQKPNLLWRAMHQIAYWFLFRPLL